MIIWFDYDLVDRVTTERAEDVAKSFTWPRDRWRGRLERSKISRLERLFSCRLARRDAATEAQAAFNMGH